MWVKDIQIKGLQKSEEIKKKNDIGGQRALQGG